jgi:hypothetical protein
MSMQMKREHLLNLAYAKDLLETPSLAARVSNYVGAPLERGFEMLPARISEAVHHATQAALQRALDVALLTLDDNPRVLSTDTFHKGIVATTGALGGAFGIGALGVELPLSTVVMLRSIADIARSEGESLRAIETKLACLEVFAFGGPSTSDDASEVGYFAVRAALSRTVAEAVQHVAERGMAANGAPALVRLIGSIASRFGIVVSEKVAAQAIPILGAAGGAAVNTLFMDHFQSMARGHFIVRRLERTYGEDVVERAYREL